MPAFIDFGPNDTKLKLANLGPLPGNALDEQVRDREKLVRLSKLPPLLIEDGEYCKLLVEARDVFVDGYYYACVAMCGITFERLQRDLAKPYHPKARTPMDKIRDLLDKHKILKARSLKLCKDMADLRNVYAHGQGCNPKRDAQKAISWLHKLIDSKTNLMRNYEIRDGMLYRNQGASPTQ